MELMKNMTMVMRMRMLVMMRMFSNLGMEVEYTDLLGVDNGADCTEARPIVRLLVFTVLHKLPCKDVLLELKTRNKMIICPVHLLLSPCATCVRNCCAKPTIVRHQPLSQFVAANVWWTYQHHWTFPVWSWIVKGDLLIDHRLSLNFKLPGIFVMASAVWHLLLLPLIAPSCAEESLVVLCLVPVDHPPSTYPWLHCPHLVCNRLLHAHSLAVEVRAGNQTGQRVLLPLPVSLPPVWILLVDHMEDVALVERDAQLPARDIVVVLCLVVNLSFKVDNSRLGRKSCVRVMLGNRNDEHCEGAGHTRKDIAHLVHILPSQLNLVDLEDLVALVQQPRPVGSATFDDPSHHNRLVLVLHSRTQRLAGLLQLDHFDVWFRVMRHAVQYYVILAERVEE